MTREALHLASDENLVRTFELVAPDSGLGCVEICFYVEFDPPKRGETQG